MKELYGNHCLLVTPMHEDGTIDESSTKSLVDYVIENGTHGILALGSSGEVFALTESERKKFIEIVVQHVNGRVPVGVGVIDSSTDRAVMLSKHAESIGVDYLFTTAPYYHPHREYSIIAHIKTIGLAVNLPVMVYDGGVNIELPLSTLNKIAKEAPNVKYSKLFVPYPEKVAAYEQGTNGNIIPFAGHDQLNYLMLLYGAKGMTSAASNVIPKEQSLIFEHIQKGDIDKARKIFLEKVAPLNAVAFATVMQFPQCYKFILKQMGVIKTDTCKTVMEPPSEVQKKELESVMKYIGLS